MLNEILCTEFKKGRIGFHPGLNVILGDDDAKNSIGKSSALMVIDFVHGGNSLLEDKSGALRELGPHIYNFSFKFAGKRYQFSRSTNAPDIVHLCNSNYESVEEITVDEFRRRLKEFHGMASLEGSFRYAIGPFSRIWGKGEMDPDHPFAANAKETTASAIARLVDLFNHSGAITSEKSVLEEQKSRKKLIVDSMNANIIPKIDKKKFSENVETISANASQMDFLRKGLGGTLAAYEALFDENLNSLQAQKNQISAARNELQTKMQRLQREISGITPRLTANIALVAEFVPGLNVKRLEEVEAFHQKIGSAVKKQLREELSVVVVEEERAGANIASLQHEIQRSLDAKGMPDDLFSRIFDLKEKNDKASTENEFYSRKKNLEDAIKATTDRLEKIYTGIFLEIEQRLNGRLRAFNRVVYGAKRKSSELRIKSASSYTFSSPDDTGTGKSFAGLIGLDLAMLSLTSLPFVIHDSVIYKNIEIAATQKILRILSAIKGKQIFLSFDEAPKFGAQVQKLIEASTVLRLSHTEQLYRKDWREKK